MLTAQGCRARRERLWGALCEQIEWALIADPRHVHYFSNFWINPLSFSAGERVFLLLERTGRATLMGDNFALRAAAGEPLADEVVGEKWYDHRHSVASRSGVLLAAVTRLLDRVAPAAGLVEGDWVPLAGLPFRNQRPDQVLGAVIRSLRRKKEADEISLLGQCIKAAAAGHARALEVVRPGVSEFDVYREVQSASMEAAARPLLVYGDFRATTLHRPRAGGLPTGYELQDGDLFILDFSVVIDGYRSDTTNTIHAGDRPRESQLELFEVCRQALQEGEAALGPGASARHVYEVVSSRLAKAGHGPLRHHAGHGIGLSHPEPPILVPQSEDELVAGDVVTLEPGLYVEGIGGIRLEHNYLITADSSVRLSHHALSLHQAHG